MVNISKIIGTMSKLQGSSARITVSGKQMLQGLEKSKKIPTEVSDTLAGIVRKHPKLKADVAYKVSERDFAVGAITLREGKQVIGRGAASISGLGTEQAVGKMRLDVGQNGEILQCRAFNDYAHTPKIQDLEFTESLKKGVLETKSSWGDYGAGSMRLDIPKATEAAGLKEEGAVILKKANSFLDKITGKIRDVLAGKDVTMPTETPSAKKITSKLTEKVNKNKITSKLTEKVDKGIPNLKKYKMPNGKLVDKQVFEKTMEDYIGDLGKLAAKDPSRVEKFAKEAKSLVKQVKEQTGYEVKSDWTKYLGDAFKG